MTPPGILREKTLIVCVGSGGVGKTTTAATMGLWAARQGRRVRGFRFGASACDF